jgi:hypothetical protein
MTIIAKLLIYIFVLRSPKHVLILVGVDPKYFSLVICKMLTSCFKFYCHHTKFPTAHSKRCSKQLPTSSFEMLLIIISPVNLRQTFK